MNYGKKHDLPFGIMDVAGLLRLNIRRRAPGQVYVDCPICGDRRGKMNLNTAKDLWRCNYCGEGGGMLSLYAKVYGVSNSDAYREICDALAVNGFSPDYTVPEKTAPTEAEQSDAASVQEVHQTLSMLLSMLTLIPAHRAHLQSVRGLSDDEITRFGFKSTPPPFLCRSLTNRLVKAGCRVQGVPGFYVDDSGCWTVKFHQRTSGIIIPIFGVDGLIRGAQIRLDHPLKDKDDPPEKTGVKYLTLSSTGKRMGTTSGSPIHFVGDPCSRVVYVTEGCLKADVAHALMHRTFVATLGANNTAKLDELFAFLHRNGTEEIIEAEDMDKYSNEMVGKGASKIYALAAKHGMRCRKLTWNPNYKGIDDWQLALRRKEQKMKEDPGMTFKEQYLNGLCGLEMLETCTEKWHAMKVDSISLRDYLGLTEQEYDAYLQTAPGVSFRELLDSQRKTQRFRVYQLDLEHGETRAFAFGGIDALHKAGFQQPPAAEYTLVYDGELICPVGQDERDILERIFARYNQAFPQDYRKIAGICRLIKPKYEYTGEVYSIVVPSGVRDIMREGDALSHCVGKSDRYWERIEQQEAYILFLRKTAEIDKPYYTLEVEPNGTIRQKRTYFDRQNDDLKDAEKFLKEWQKVVSERLTESDREKAEKSKVLRLQEFEQLRQDDIRIHTGDLAGQRLVDVLVSDLMETAA